MNMTHMFVIVEYHSVKNVSDISSILELPPKPQSDQCRAMKDRNTSSKLMEVVKELKHVYAESDIVVVAKRF